jgi:Mn-dependent DtxR family transcriptional regulator
MPIFQHAIPDLASAKSVRQLKAVITIRCSHGALAELLKRLRVAGLVTRKPEGGFYLTDAGRAWKPQEEL